MNEELQTALADILLKAAETAETASGFVLAQMPDVVQQLLTWKFVVSIILWVIGIALIVAAPIALKKIQNFLPPQHSQKHKERAVELDKKGYAGRSLEEDGELSRLGYNFHRRLVWLVFIAWVPGWAMFFANLTWLQIWLAPKIYLIEYATKLISN